MPEGVSPDVLSFWWPESGGVVQNDFLCITRAAESPVLAHLFLDFLLNEANAFQNFTDFNGYIPPQRGIDADALLNEGSSPKPSRPRHPPEQFLANRPAAVTRKASVSGTTLGPVQGGLVRASPWRYRPHFCAAITRRQSPPRPYKASQPCLRSSAHSCLVLATQKAGRHHHRRH